MTVCSGIGAPEVAAPFIDWRYQSEIEKFPSAVLAARFPHAVNLGDMTKFKEWPDANVDVLVGGTPCQSFSVAGLRKGMEDPRGNLALTYLAIADRYRPKWLVWENVPGVLSSNGGRDFGSILGGMAELGYGVSYRILDAQFVRVESHARAVPQRRRRVFVVGYLGDWRRAAAVLFERESLSGHPAPRRKAGQGFAGGIEIGPSGGSFADVNPTLDARAKDGPIRNQIAGAVLCADVAPTLNAHFGEKQGLEDQHIRGGQDCSLPPTAMCLNAGAMGRQDAESETLIPITGGGFDVAGTMKSMDKSGGWSNSADHAAAEYMIPVVQAYDTRNGMAPHGSMQGDVISPSLRAKEAEPPMVTYPINTQIAMRHEALGEGTGMGIGAIDDPSFTLQAGHSHAVGVFKGGQGSKAGGIGYSNEVAPTLSSADSGTQQSPTMHQGMAVRRFTPTECERLQGFEDGHTAITFRGKPAADGQRCKALGNSMACNVMAWILERIHEAHSTHAGVTG